MRTILSLLLIFMMAMVPAAILAQNRSVSSEPNPEAEALKKLADKFSRKYELQRAEVERIARERGWKIRDTSNNRESQIIMIDERGFPQVYTNANLNAGRTTNTDDIWSGGSSGLNLTGVNYIIGEWDGGAVRTAHQEFNNASGGRVTQKDAPASTSDHATHVAGTMVAEGQDASAHGMATAATLYAYDWDNDNTEMTNEAAAGLTVSNHSYGWKRGWENESGTWYWWGDPTISATEDWGFGFYNSTSQEWDEIAFNAPNYLIVKASMNNRNDDWNGGHYYYNGASWVWSNVARDPDGGADGYDCIDQRGVAKNILTIGAVDDIPAGWASPANVVQSSFSGWGPTDDGRIKPDLVANGVNLYSSSSAGNNMYTTMSGTSMASPNTTGTLALIQQHYKNLRGGVMSSAALKGLVINTANEAGPANGPDYQNGWGLLNATGATTLITQDNNEGGLILQAKLNNGQTTDYTYYSDGVTPVNVTLCWTDPAGTPPANSLNPATLMLVNNLNLKLINHFGSEAFPWVLNPASPANAASKGINTRDNVETVNILTPSKGYYTIRVSHSGALSGGSQSYALIVRGLTTPPLANPCTARSTGWSSFEYIKNVTMGFNQNSDRGPGGYSDFTGVVNTILKGATENLSVTIQGYSSSEVRAWIDWNQDGDFSDAGESYNLGSGAGPTFTLGITAPSNAKGGYTTMRVRVGFGVPSSCGTVSYGETEDYTLNVAYGCVASGGCDEYISRVQAGTIDNSSGCSHYSDYSLTHSTNLPLNGIIHMTVTNGNGFSQDQCGIWVDWNRNGSFSDAGEQITVSGTPSAGPYTATIIPPAGQTMGNCIMRIRITYDETPTPCGTTTYGEVEDYNLNITAKVPNVWTGNLNNYWGNAPNWSLEHVPTADEDVIIPNVNQPCIVDFSPKSCNNLTTYAGTTLKISGNTLTVNGNMSISGQLAMDNATGGLTAMNDLYWESGSTANVTANVVTWVHGDMEFRSGSNVQISTGNINFTGTGSSYIRVYAPNSQFNGLGSYKSGGATTVLSSLSDYDLKVKSNLYIHPGANYTQGSPFHLIVQGTMQNNGNYYFNGGALKMDGVSASIKPGTDSYLNDLIVSTSGTTSFDHTLTDTLVINGDLLIESGVFNPASQAVLIKGNWTNQVGTAAFTEGTGRVIFNGAAHQYVYSNETFNILEAKMGAALRVSNVAHTVTCNQYDWSAGGIDVLAGTFTALDLAENGLYGGYWLNPGGTINVYNNDNYIDLNGSLNIYGGNFNIYGGIGIDSYWPYAANASITMSDGVLDIKNVGVLVYNSGLFSLTSSITGGTIRTSRSFNVQRADFNPTGGLIEFYGTTDGSLSSTAGSVFNVLINKAVADDMGEGGNPRLVDRETGTITDLPLANTITLAGNTDINGNITFQNGTLHGSSHTLRVAGDWNNPTGGGEFVAGTGTVEFDGAASADINAETEVFYNLNLNKTYASFDGLEIAGAIYTNNNLTVTNGTFEMNDPAMLVVSGNLNIALNAGLNANDVYGPSIYVKGSWSNSNTSYSTTAGFDPGASTVFFTGSGDQFITAAAPQETFYRIYMAKASGKLRSNDNLLLLDDLIINSGTWEDNIAGLSHVINGDLTVASPGIFLPGFASNTVEFAGLAPSTITFPTSSSYFSNLRINKSTGVAVNLASNVYCQFNGNLTIDNGILYQYSYDLLVSGDVAINDQGELNLGSSAFLYLTNANTLNVNSGGVFKATGLPSFPAMVSANVSTDRYNFNVNSGGTISAFACTFKHMSANGINILSGAIVDDVNAFKNCTFQEGTAGGTLLTVNNNQTFTARNISFPANTWSGNSNVRKTVNVGRVYFVDYSGTFSGETFDDDSFNRLDWLATLTATATATPTSICSGSTTQLNVGRSGGLSPYTYTWSPAGSLSNASLQNPVASPLANTTYSVTVTDALGTTATSSVAVTVNSVLPVSVTISPSANPSAPGNFVLFTATPVNGGSSPVYQWKVNGSNVGTGLSTYTYVPSNGDQVSCVLTSNYACPSGNPATSNVITMAVVVANNTVTGTVPSPLSLCFDASNTITVAGGGSTFVVQPGASATMIAGMKIRYLPGTTVQPGGYMHGYITLTNSYCASPEPSMVSTITGTGEPELTSSVTRYSVFPNPTNGFFSVVQNDGPTPDQVNVEIISMRGEKLSSETIRQERKHGFDLRGYAPGLYFVRITSEGNSETFKLILTR